MITVTEPKIQIDRAIDRGNFFTSIDSSTSFTIVLTGLAAVTVIVVIYKAMSSIYRYVRMGKTAIEVQRAIDEEAEGEEEEEEKRRGRGVNVDDDDDEMPSIKNNNLNEWLQRDVGLSNRSINLYCSKLSQVGIDNVTDLAKKLKSGEPSVMLEMLEIFSKNNFVLVTQAISKLSCPSSNSNSIGITNSNTNTNIRSSSAKKSQKNVSSIDRETKIDGNTIANSNGNGYSNNGRGRSTTPCKRNNSKSSQLEEVIDKDRDRDRDRGDSKFCDNTNTINNNNSDRPTRARTPAKRGRS